MSNQNRTTTQTSDTPAPGQPATNPDALVAQLRAMRAQIPEYTQLAAAERRSLITVAKATDPEFVQAAINSIGASSNVQQAIGSTPEELRHDTMDANGWTALEDEARAFLNGIVAGNLVRKYRIGKKALAAYSIAKRLVQDPEHADLLPHVETMKRLNRFGKKRAKTAAPAAPTLPVPATTAAQPATASPDPPEAS